MRHDFDREHCYCHTKSVYRLNVFLYCVRASLSSNTKVRFTKVLLYLNTDWMCFCIVLGLPCLKHKGVFFSITIKDQGFFMCCILFIYRHRVSVFCRKCHSVWRKIVYCFQLWYYSAVGTHDAGKKTQFSPREQNIF